MAGRISTLISDVGLYHQCRSSEIIKGRKDGKTGRKSHSHHRDIETARVGQLQPPKSNIQLDPVSMVIIIPLSIRAINTISSTFFPKLKAAGFSTKSDSRFDHDESSGKSLHSSVYTLFIGWRDRRVFSKCIYHVFHAFYIFGGWSLFFLFFPMSI